MKTQNEILKSLWLMKSPINLEVAKNYQNILKFLQEVKNDVINVDIIDFQKLEYPEREYRYGEYKPINRELHKVFNLENLKTLKITTTYGCYEITVPTDTDFYVYLCVLLKIQTEPIKNKIEVENTIFAENEIVQNITKAKKITNEKAVLEIAKYIFLNFENDKVNVFSTTGRIIYKSKKFDFVSDKKIENFILPIAINDLELCKTAKNEFLKIDIIDKENVLINDKKAKIETNFNFEQLEYLVNFNFESTCKMEFSKIEMQKNIKSIKFLLDYRKIININLNGNVKIKPITNEQTKTELSFNYISKDFYDLNFNVFYDDLYNGLSVLNSKNIFYSPKDKNSILTNENDYILIANYTE